MKFRGFNGIRVNFPRPGDLDSIFDVNVGKFRLPQEVILSMKERVRLALDRGYFVIINGPSIDYGRLEDHTDPTDRLTDNHVQRHYDMWEHFVREFKDFPDSVAYKPFSEVHPWDSEQRLPASDSNHLTLAQFNVKFVAHYQTFNQILRRIDPYRSIFYNPPWKDWYAKFNFPFPGEGLRMYASKDSGNYQPYSKPLIYVAWGEKDPVMHNDTVSISGLSLPKEKQNKLVVYPNPAHQLIQVDMSPELNNGTFSLFELNGRKLLMQQVVAGDQIPLTGLATGVYLYTFSKGTYGQYGQYGKLIIR